MLLRRFQFRDPGALIDGDLELVPPDGLLADEFLAACAHPMTQQHAPADAQVTREQLCRFLDAAPGGRETGNKVTGKSPQYHFWMRQHDGAWGKPDSPPTRIVGAISFRVGSSHSIEYYYGHVGYHVYPAARGRRYAERACQLLLPLARAHGFKTLWITCNPDNLASRRTCEHLGAMLIEVVAVPPGNPLYSRGECVKCRYRLDLPR